VFETNFMHDSFVCRRGKGTFAASDRLMAFLRRVTANGRRRRAWALKLDVASFFPSIHKETLDAILAAKDDPAAGSLMAHAHAALPRPHGQLPVSLPHPGRPRSGLRPLPHPA